MTILYLTTYEWGQEGELPSNLLGADSKQWFPMLGEPEKWIIRLSY